MNFLSTSIADLTLVILTMVTGVLIARSLGPTGRGELAVVILWPTLIASIGSLGIKSALTFNVAIGNLDQKRLAGNAILIAIFQSILLVYLGSMTIPLLLRTYSLDVTNTCLIFLAFIPLNLIGQYLLGLLQGKLLLINYNLIRLTVNISYMVAVLYLVSIEQVTVWNLMLCLLASNLITTLSAFSSVYYRNGFTLIPDPGLIFQLFQYGIKNHLGTISNILNQRFDQMILAIILTPYQVGLYTVAVSFANLAQVGARSFATYLFPKIASSDAASQKQIIERYSSWNFTVSSIIGCLLLIIAPKAIPLFYGGQYSSSVSSAEVLLIAVIILGIANPWAETLRGINQPFAVTKAELLAFGVTCIGLYLFLRPFGILGAAATSLLAYLTSAVYVYMQLRRHISVRLLDVLKFTFPFDIVAKIFTWRTN